jgi:Dolichyl-phosphate-mannose-protein mannosyltransferase
MANFNKGLQGFLRLSLTERLVDTLLVLTAVNFLVVLIIGGYKFTVVSFQVSAHLRNSLLFLVIFAMLKVWLGGKKRGLPSFVRLRSAWLMFLSIVLIYTLNGKTLSSPDNIPARYLPLSILREFNFDLDEFPVLYEPGLPLFLTKRHGHIVSTYPPWAAVLALPVYLLPVLGGISPQSPVLPELEKLAATLIMALSVLLLFFAVRRMTQERIAWLIAWIYAFGTSSFNISSQALWQHGPSQLFLTLMIYCLVRGLEEPKFSAYAGFGLASAIICRPLNIVIALPIAAYILFRRRSQLIGFILSTLPPLLLFMGYNHSYFDSPIATGFASMVIKPSGLWTAALSSFDTPLHEGLTGVLASPSRGLLIYSPIFLFSFVGMVMVWRESGHILLKFLSLAPFLFILPIAKWATWWGGAPMARGFWPTSPRFSASFYLRRLSGLGGKLF